MEQARQNLEAQVLERAAQGPEFRNQLKQGPLGTVSREFGVQIPSDITVEVLEETPAKVYLVLPPTPLQPGQELSASELEAVAGGWTGVTNECGTCGLQSCACWSAPGKAC